MTTVQKKRVKDMTPEERKLYNAESKRWQREKEKGLLPGSDEETLANRRAELDVTRVWEANWAKATDEERIQVGAWGDMCKLMEIAIEVLDEESTPENEEFLALIAVEVDAYVAKYPPVQGDLLYKIIQNTSPRHAGFAAIQQRIKAKSIGPMFSKFGVPCDGVHGPIYSHFVSKVRDRRNKDREAESAVSPPLTEIERRNNAVVIGRTV